MGSRVVQTRRELKSVSIEKVEKYLRRREIAPTRFGRDVVGDPRFVFDLRNGREPLPRTIMRVRAYLEAVQ